jgi:hypothetical protein
MVQDPQGGGVMAGQKYQVTALPFEGHEQYYRSGHRFGKDAVTVTISESPSGPYELTQEQFNQLKDDERIKVSEGEAAPATQRSSEVVTSSSDDQESARRRR